MHSAVATHWKKVTFFGIGLLAVVVLAIFSGIYAANHAEANKSSANVTMPEEAEMRIELDVVNGLMNSDEVIDDAASGSNTSNGSQQSAASQNVEVRVNGVPVEAPQNGTVHEVINTEDGSTHVNITSQSNTSSNSDSRSRINVDVDSSVRIRE